MTNSDLHTRNFPVRNWGRSVGGFAFPRRGRGAPGRWRGEVAAVSRASAIGETAWEGCARASGCVRATLGCFIGFQLWLLGTKNASCLSQTLPCRYPCSTRTTRLLLLRSQQTETVFQFLWNQSQTMGPWFSRSQGMAASRRPKQELCGSPLGQVEEKSTVCLGTTKKWRWFPDICSPTQQPWIAGDSWRPRDSGWSQHIKSDLKWSRFNESVHGQCIKLNINDVALVMSCSSWLP